MLCVAFSLPKTIESSLQFLKCNSIISSVDSAPLLQLSTSPKALYFPPLFPGLNVLSAVLLPLTRASTETFGMLSAHEVFEVPFAQPPEANQREFSRNLRSINQSLVELK